MKNWETVYKNENKMRANVLLDELLANEIDAVLLDKEDSLFPIMGFAEIRVPIHEVEKAKRIIDDFDAKETR